MTPDVFSGVWRRRSIAIGEGKPDEPASVHWIQWGDRFLDVRQPHRDGARLSGPGVFGGSTTWREPVLTWHHELDSAPGGATDAGDISWADDDLVEVGSFDVDGRAVPYVEVWERLTDPLPTDGRVWSPWANAMALEVDGYRAVAVIMPDGRWLGAMSGRDGVNRWQLSSCVGDAGLLGGAVRRALLGPG